MIMRLQGTVIDRSLDWVLLNVAGVGYRIDVSSAHVAELREGDEAVLWTHEVIRDDKHALFGFRSRDALELFWKLITVNGVGPKAGVKILGMYDVHTIRRQVMAGDAGFLTKVPGVGKKTAQKIVLELRGSIDLEKEVRKDEIAENNLELVDALVSLGFASQEARTIAAEIPDNIESIEDKIKAALQTAA